MITLDTSGKKNIILLKVKITQGKPTLQTQL
jgi:hypothetical protein